MWLKISVGALLILATVFLGQCGIMLWDAATLHEDVRLAPDARYEFPFSTPRTATYDVYIEYSRTKPAPRGVDAVHDSDLAASQIDFEILNEGTSVPFHPTRAYQDAARFTEYVGYFEATRGVTYVLRMAVSHEGVPATTDPALLGVTLDPELSKPMYVRQVLILEASALIFVGLAIRHLYRSSRLSRTTPSSRPHN